MYAAIVNCIWITWLGEPCGWKAVASVCLGLYGDLPSPSSHCRRAGSTGSAQSSYREIYPPTPVGMRTPPPSVSINKPLLIIGLILCWWWYLCSSILMPVKSWQVRKMPWTQLHLWPSEKEVFFLYPPSFLPQPLPASLIPLLYFLLTLSTSLCVWVSGTSEIILTNRMMWWWWWRL